MVNMKKLSVIITVLNDEEEANATIRSIRETAEDKPEIVVVDDASEKPLQLEDKDVIFVRNDVRSGVGDARHQAIQLATTDNILITDAHMRFDKGWYEASVEAVESSTNTLWSGTCLGLGEGFMDLSKHRGEYNGATLCLYNKTRREILEGKWISDRPGTDNYELACIMGALYLMPKAFYFKIRGLEGLKGWGSDEPFLSLKTWLAGGEVRILKKLRAGHKFRNVAPYATWTPHFSYNKLMILYTVLGQDIFNKLSDKFPVNNDVAVSKSLIDHEKKQFDSIKKYYAGIFTRSPEWYLEKFQIEYEV